MAAAIEAARVHMPTDSIEQVTTQTRWEHRHWDPGPVVMPKAEYEQVEEIDDDCEWEDDK
ncbi:hypothetical protein [Streptomyces rubiginosohelvolus]|uniref:hypothetical protein n=1 Tax=Streptomyces rubiginosohelvolus TaxID=67362 RepID=UPI003652FCD4